MKVILSFLLFTLRIPAAGGPPQTIDERMSEGIALQGAGQYGAAVLAFQQAEAMAEHSKLTDRQLAGVYDALASAYADAGQYAESEHEYLRALALVQKNDGPNSLGYALLLASVSQLPTQTGKREGVIPVLREAITANARTGSAQDLGALRTCLANILRQQKRYLEIESLLLYSQPDLNGLETANPRLLFNVLKELGMLRFDQDRYQESVDLHHESIRVLQTAFGSEHPSLVVPLNNLAASYAKMGRFSDSGLAYQRAIAVCIKALGMDHLSCGILLQNYAVVLRKLGRKHEAKKLEQQGREIELASNRHNGVGTTINVTALRSSGK